MSGDSSIEDIQISKSSTVTTHRIGDWRIQESLQPFPKESDVRRWSIDDVCVLVEDLLSTKDYTSIIQEHLIDGFALLLLKDEHLINVFQMPFKHRTKLLHRIQQLQL